MKGNRKLIELLTGKKGIKILLATAVLGVGLIVLSECLTPQKEEAPPLGIETANEAALEQKLIAVVTAITGEAAPRVMLTLESTGRQVYATQSKEKNREDGAQWESEESYIIIKNADGTQEALQITEIQPEVKGVVVVSQYAKSAPLRESIVNAVCTVLGLSTNKVCVVTKND